MLNFENYKRKTYVCHGLYHQLLHSFKVVSSMFLWGAS